MLDTVIRRALQHRLFVVLVSVLWLAYGLSVLVGLPIDVFPDLNRPTITLLTEAGGLSPEEVELFVTRPVEQSMAGAPGVERVRSQSGPGLSVVWIEFTWQTDLLVARQQVSERLVQVSAELPDGIMSQMGPISSIMGEILLVGLSSDIRDGPALRSVAETMIRPRLRAIGGVSQVIAIGGGLEIVDVAIDPVALAARDLTIADVSAAAAAAQGVTTGGFLERKSQEYLIRNLARTTDPDAIASTVVATRDGVVVTLGQVADVRRGVAPMRGDAGVNGKPGVILSVQKQPGISTVELTERIDAALHDLTGALPADIEMVPLFRQASFIEAAVGNVEDALRDGVILVTLILVAFLLSWRTTFITLTAIPLSLITAVVVLSAMGLSINTMTLGGLAVAIGELVDDAIVDVENVYRRLKLNAVSPDPRHPIRVIFEASREVRGSIVYSTMVVVLVFVPLFAMSGIEGRLFAPLGVAYITSILASMAVSLTVTPALCSWLLPSAVSGRDHQDSWLVRRLKAADVRLLAWALPRPRLVIGLTTVMVLLAVSSVPFLGTSFLPTFNEGTATINLQAAPGTSLETSNQLGNLAERLILSSPEVVSVGRRTGRAELDEHAEGVHYSEIDVDFARDGRSREVVLAEIRGNLARIPGIVVNVGQPISHRLDHLLSGVRAAIAIKVYGEDLAALRSRANEIEQAIASVDGLVDLQTERQVLVPQVHVRIDRERAKRFGIAPGDLADALQTALGGRTVGQVLEGLRSIDIVVRYRADARNDVAVLERMPIQLHEGREITLGQVADVSVSSGPNQILHENGRRRIVIGANTAGRDIGSVVRDVQRRIEQLEARDGLTVAIEGQFESQRQATRTIALLSLVSLLGIYGVLFSHFRSHVITLQILVNIPLALIGSVAALWLTGSTLSVATLVGFVALCGIATRNTLLMIAHYLHLMEQEGMSFGEAMVVRGSLERLVPVAMTALTAGMGLLPLAVAGGSPGKELLTPVAQVILGGLLTSTLLDTLVTPTVFLWLGAGFAQRHGAHLSTDPLNL